MQHCRVSRLHSLRLQTCTQKEDCRRKSLHCCILDRCPQKALLSQIWSRSRGFMDFSGSGRVVTPPQRDKPLLTPVLRNFLRNLNSQTNKWGPRKGEWPLWGEEEHGYRRNFPDEGKWSSVPVAPTTGQAERPAVRLPHPQPLKGRTGRMPRPTSGNFRTFWSEKQLGRKESRRKDRRQAADPGYIVGQCPPPVLGCFWIKSGIGELFPRIPLGVRKPGVAPDWVPLWGNSLRAATF